MKARSKYFILLIGSRNMFQHSGEGKLISERAKSLKRVLGVDTIMYNLKRIKNREEIKRHNLYEEDGLIIKNYYFSNLFNFFVNYYILLKNLIIFLKNNKPRLILFSGFISYFFWPFLRLPSIKTNIHFGVDIHGALEELIEYSPGSVIKMMYYKFLYWFLKCVEKVVVKKSDVCIVVSNPLAKYCKDEYKAKEIIIIPCGITEILDVGKIIKMRNNWREKLNIQDETIVVYCGGLSRWQVINKNCYLFKKIKDLFINSKLLLITPDPEKAIEIALSMGIKREEIISIFVDQKDVINVLCAADIGLMLRENKVTNVVAFPNKFSDYLNAGLIIITSAFVVDPSRILRGGNIGVVLNDEELRIDERSINELITLYERRKKKLNSYYYETRSIMYKHVYMDIYVSKLKMFLFN